MLLYAVVGSNYCTDANFLFLSMSTALKCLPIDFCSSIGGADDLAVLLRSPFERCNNHGAAVSFAFFESILRSRIIHQGMKSIS